MRYIIIGAGGMGGVIGGYLSAGGKDVALIARGAHLAAIRQNGLTIKSAIKGELNCKSIEAYAAEDDFIPGDAVFVCVKGYSLLEAAPVIAKAARAGAVVIPILNSLQAGAKLQQALPHLTVLDGCIYTSAFISAPGEITQPAAFCRIVFGARAGQQADAERLSQIAAELNACGIDTKVSPAIEVDMFKKFAFISPFAGADSYYDVNAGLLQQEGEARQMFLSLLGELQSLAAALALPLEGDLCADTLKILGNTAAEVTTSMHKDVAAGKNFEKQELIFDVVELAAQLGVSVPTYHKVAEHFGYGK